MARIALLDLNGGKPNEAVGLLLAAIAEAGHDAGVVDVLGGEPLPQAADALLVTGGPGSPHAPGPWQAPLRATLRRALADETPLLCICLGLQIIAGELGSRVMPLAAARFGLYPVGLTSEGREDTLLGGAQAGAAFEQRRYGLWDGDLVVLARGPEHDVTAARLGPAAWGCVFHPEATHSALAAWMDRPEPARKIRAGGGDQALQDMRDQLPAVQAVHEAVVGGWLQWLA